MTTTAIISNIRKLPLTEQYFVVEQVMHSLKVEQTEKILVLPDWQKKILQQRLANIGQGNTMSQKETHKIFERCLA